MAVVVTTNRWGYTLLSDLEAVVSNYSAAGLPLEGLWVDIEMFNNRFQVFTFDQREWLSRCRHVCSGRPASSLNMCAAPHAYTSPDCCTHHPAQPCVSAKTHKFTTKHRALPCR